ncbi:protein N-lysine methyltransferase METTL21A [Iris pallida]|uniref:Protein N-lysine methyltransferase METTL21A n=1 Tax=Iris pallida TaxID=29817 RepID=A0AAX6FQC8_IRIPA|nr:protein N-lysine methyltransferase METTL21A [Iris pallida]
MAEIPPPSPRMTTMGWYSSPVEEIEDAAGEIMLLWSLQQPTIRKPNSLVRQSSQTLPLDSCGHSLTILQSPSSMATPGVTGAVMWDSGSSSPSSSSTPPTPPPSPCPGRGRSSSAPAAASSAASPPSSAPTSSSPTSPTASASSGRTSTRISGAKSAAPPEWRSSPGATTSTPTSSLLRIPISCSARMSYIARPRCLICCAR